MRGGEGRGGGLITEILRYHGIAKLGIEGFHGGHVGDQNNNISILWESNSVFMQTIAIVSDQQHWPP